MKRTDPIPRQRVDDEKRRLVHKLADAASAAAAAASDLERAIEIQERRVAGDLDGEVTEREIHRRASDVFEAALRTWLLAARLGTLRDIDYPLDP